MDAETKQNNTAEPTQITPTTIEVVSAGVANVGVPAPKNFPQRSFRDHKKNVRKSPRREPRAKPEFDQKIIDIRRVARVVAGGRRFSFSVALVAGNRKGSVGV